MAAPTHTARECCSAPRRPAPVDLYRNGSLGCSPGAWRVGNRPFGAHPCPRAAYAPGALPCLSARSADCTARTSPTSRATTSSAVSAIQIARATAIPTAIIIHCHTDVTARLSMQRDISLQKKLSLCAVLLLLSAAPRSTCGELFLSVHPNASGAS